MQANDVVNLVSGGRRGKGRLLRPLLRGFAGRLLGDDEDADQVGGLRGRKSQGVLGGVIGRGGPTKIFRKLLSRGCSADTSEAEEVLEELDNESTASKESGACCHHLTGGYKIHMLFFLLTFAITLNWSATGYAIYRKVCLAQNTSSDRKTTNEEFCQRWLLPNNTRLEPHSIKDFMENIFGSQVSNLGTSTSAGLSPAFRAPNISVPIHPLQKHRRRSQGGAAEETAQLYMTYQAIVALVPPALVMMFIVFSYRDEFENFKTPLLVGLFGIALSTSGNFLSSRFPFAPLYVDILTPLGEMLCGGLPVILMCVYVHLAASVPSKGRTTAFFLLQVSFLLSFSIARLTTALIVEAWAVILPAFMASFVALTLAVIFTIAFVGHVDMYADSDETQRRHRHQTVGGGQRSTSDPVLLSSRLFSHHHLLHSMRGLVREQAQGTKYELLFVTATVFFLVVTTNGSVTGLFLENTSQSGDVILESVVIIVTVVVVLPIFVIIVRKLPFDPNYTITFIGVFILTASQSLHLASTGGGHNSAAMNRIQHVLRTLCNLAPAGMRAHVATLVERQKFGKAFAAVAACEAVAPLIGTGLRKLIGRGLGQLPLLLMLWGTMLMLGLGQCRRRRPQVATAAVEEDE